MTISMGALLDAVGRMDPEERCIRGLAKGTKWVRRYGSLPEALHALIRDVRDLRTTLCDNEIDSLVAQYDASEPVTITD